MNHSIDVQYMVPAHYLDEYPKFVQFMNAYFGWMYNNGGFNQGEIEDMIKGGMTPDEIMSIQSVKNPGASARDMASDKMLERSFSELTTLDGMTIVTSDDRPLFTEDDKTPYKVSWLNDMGFPITSREPGTEKFRNIDTTRLIKLLAHIYSIRGSVKCMELFFSIFFEGAVTVAFPRSQISTIDSNFTLDASTNTIRDDVYYSEYSYVISTSGQPDSNLNVFLKLYKDMFHPAGFQVFFEEGYDRSVTNELTAAAEGYRVAGMVTLPYRFSRYVDDSIDGAVVSNVNSLENYVYNIMPPKLEPRIEDYEVSQVELQADRLQFIFQNRMPDNFLYGDHNREVLFIEARTDDIEHIIYSVIPTNLS